VCRLPTDCLKAFVLRADLVAFVERRCCWGFWGVSFSFTFSHLFGVGRWGAFVVGSGFFLLLLSMRFLWMGWDGRMNDFSGCQSLGDDGVGRASVEVEIVSLGSSLSLCGYV
jgi:hypothetical protein